jgi:hypothetical protein
MGMFMPRLLFRPSVINTCHRDCSKQGKEEANAFSLSIENYFRSRIHEHTISLRILGIILRVLRLEVSVWIS